MEIPTMEGIDARRITTPRLASRVLFSGPEDGAPVLFLHGNTSCATWWEPTMLDLPEGYRGIAPDQRGYGEADPEAKIDATRGMGDLVDDAAALLDHLGLERVHLVGISLGGNVLWRFLADHPAKARSATVINPGSPYGFSGVKGLDGEPNTPDFAGSGGGLSNPELIQRILDGDRSMDSQFSPRAAIRNLLVKPPFVPPNEEALLSGLLATHIGDQDIPGDSTPSPHWPHFGPGVWGATNALSPKYNQFVDHLVGAEPKTQVLWLRGSHDLVVSDTAAADPGVLGQMGLLPGWPGAEAYPPQPMLAQTRSVLERYAAAGGGFSEVIIADAGHLAYLEKPEAFNRHFHAHLAADE